MFSQNEILEKLNELLSLVKGPGPFTCNNCPKNRDKERGPWCPAWGQILLTVTGPNGKQDQVHEACYFDRMERWHEGIHGAFTINIDSLNETRKEVNAVSEKIPLVVLGMAQYLVTHHEQSTKFLEHGQGEER